MPDLKIELGKEKKDRKKAKRYIKEPQREGKISIKLENEKSKRSLSSGEMVKAEITILDKN